jgi:hypothetical protein
LVGGTVGDCPLKNPGFCQKGIAVAKEKLLPGKSILIALSERRFPENGTGANGGNGEGIETPPFPLLAPVQIRLGSAIR